MSEPPASRAAPAKGRPDAGADRPAPAADAPSSRKVVLAACEIRKALSVGDRELEVLHGVDLELREGERLALIGASGAGKSTLLHILGLLDPPTAGAVLLGGRSAWDLPPSVRAALRNARLGFVFQFYHLLPELTALENVMLPAMISQSQREFAKHRREHYLVARELLDSFGLASRTKHRPSQLSGGERQRVALARALFLNPPILIADEPTGNLDSATGERVLELLFREQQRRGFSLLLVTHDERLAARCDRQLVMDDGTLRESSVARAAAPEPHAETRPPAQAAPAPRPTAAAAAASGRSTDPEPGVRGWLRCFVALHLYAAPAAYLTAQAFKWQLYDLLAPDHPRLMAVWTVESLVGLALTLKWIRVGLHLYRRSPRVVFAVKRLLLLTFGWNLLASHFGFIWGLEPTEVIAGAVRTLVVGGLALGLWYAYFERSKRVRVTYPDWDE